MILPRCARQNLHLPSGIIPPIQYMIHYSPGDVVLINFPFTDLTGIKQRPVVVISQTWFNKRSTDIIVAAITSKLPTRYLASDCVLSATEQLAAGLPKRSMVRLGKIVTLDKRLIRKKLGTISPETLAKFRIILLNLHI